jgi:hypothetical protein
MDTRTELTSFLCCSLTQHGHRNNICLNLFSTEMVFNDALTTHTHTHTHRHRHTEHTIHQSSNRCSYLGGEQTVASTVICNHFHLVLLLDTL